MALVQRVDDGAGSLLDQTVILLILLEGLEEGDKRGTQEGCQPGLSALVHAIAARLIEGFANDPTGAPQEGP